MKAVIIKARGNYQAGQEIEVAGDDFEVLERDGIAVTRGEYTAIQAREAETKAVRASTITRHENAIKAKIAEAKKRNAIVPADETVQAKSLERFKAFENASIEQIDQVAEIIGATIDALQPKGHAELTKKWAGVNNATDREGFRAAEIQFQGVSFEDAGKEYVRCSEPMTNLVRSGDFKEAFKLSRERAIVASQHLMKPINAGDDFMLRDIIRAADYTDPNSQVGTLATGLILMRNLGYLKNKLSWMPYFTTDLRNEPIQFGHPVITRYITPPGVLTYIPGVGFTSDATTISNAGAGSVQSGIATQTSGTVTKSTPGATDVSVTINQFKGTEIEFPISTLAATVRNLFAEQRGAQTYSLAEHINDFVMQKIFASTWQGTVTSLTLGNSFGLPGMIALKNRMTLSKIPDAGRFALLHSTYSDALLTDGNMLTAKAILALINKDASAFEQSDIPSLFGIKPLEAQRASYTAANAYASPNISPDGVTVDFAAAGVTKIGFAGNMSSMLFASRVPQDFTKAAQELGIPATSAIEIVTEPDSGLSVMVFKYVDNGKMSISHRVCLMYGAAQGDPRVGIVLAP